MGLFFIETINSRIGRLKNLIFKLFLNTLYKNKFHFSMIRNIMKGMQRLYPWIDCSKHPVKQNTLFTKWHCILRLNCFLFIYWKFVGKVLTGGYLGSGGGLTGGFLWRFDKTIINAFKMKWQLFTKKVTLIKVCVKNWSWENNATFVHYVLWIL
jgi:hypothetical protein